MSMMRMLASRQNSRWAEAVEWDVPYTFDATKFPTLLGQNPSLIALPVVLPEAVTTSVGQGCKPKRLSFLPCSTCCCH